MLQAQGKPQQAPTAPSQSTNQEEKVGLQKGIFSITSSDLLKMSAEEEERYYTERDIEFTLLAQGPGVIKAHSVIELNSGDKVLVLEKAGIDVKRLDGNTETIVDCHRYTKAISKGEISQADTIKVCEAFSDALEGIERLHKKGMIVRDLKLANILITAEGKGVLADLGAVAMETDPQTKTVDPAIKQRFGTDRLYSPEAIALEVAGPPRKRNQLDQLTVQTDIWTLGIMLSQLGVIHGDDFPSQELLDSINHPSWARRLKGYYKENEYPGRIPKPEPNTFEHLCWRCLEMDPQERPTIEEFREEYDAALEKWQDELAEKDALGVWREALPRQ